MALWARKVVGASEKWTQIMDNTSCENNEINEINQYIFKFQVSQNKGNAWKPATADVASLSILINLFIVIVMDVKLQIMDVTVCGKDLNIHVWN